MEQTRLMRLAAASLTVGIALAAIPVEAGTDSWSIAGSPSGGWVGKLIVDPSTPSTLYTLSSSGVYKSTDSGGSWSVILPRLDQPEDMAIDPLHPATLYVASGASEGVATIVKTTDGGATWTDADTGIGQIEGSEPDAIFGITVDPVDEGTLYATALNTGVYKSTDGGAHWHTINTGLGGLIGGSLEGFIYPVAVDPANPQILYFGTQVAGPNGGAFADQALSGIFRSTDGGAHWTQRLDHQGVTYIVPDPSNPATVYAGGPWVSTDSGDTWSPMSGPVYQVLVVDPSDSLHMWGNDFATGVYETTDGGTTWNPASLGSGISAATVAMDPVTPANVYAATNWGVFKSADSGATWAAANQGLHNVVVDQMLEGKDGIVYLASGGNGIYKSADQGVTWAQVGAASGPTGSLPTAGDDVTVLVQDPKANSTLYAGTTGGIYMTTDGGDSWSETDSGVPGGGYTLGLAMDPEVPTTLYAATDRDGAGVYKSIDGGTTWNASGTGLKISSAGGFQALAVDPHHSDVVYAGAFATGLYKSTDGGASWQADDGAIGVTDIWAIAVDPTDSNVVYTATSNGFFKSTDAGATWTESDNGLDGHWLMTDIQIDAADPSIIVASQRYGMGDSYISPDGGADWFDLATLTSSSARTAAQPKSMGASVHKMFRPGAPQSRSVPKLLISAAVMDPRHPTDLFGGGSDGQVYRMNVKDLPKVTSSGGGTPPPASSGGGGDLSLLMLGLLGFAALRRKI